MNDGFLILFISILIYILILWILKELNFGRKISTKTCNNCCPDCNEPLSRVKRILLDKILYHLTFRMFDFKRYFCNECGWEGLRWEK